MVVVALHARRERAAICRTVSIELLHTRSLFATIAAHVVQCSVRKRAVIVRARVKLRLSRSRTVNRKPNIGSRSTLQQRTILKRAKDTIGILLCANISEVVSACPNVFDRLDNILFKNVQTRASTALLRTDGLLGIDTPNVRACVALDCGAHVLLLQCPWRRKLSSRTFLQVRGRVRCRVS